MSSEPAKLTPMMQQYFEVRRGLPKDTFLLFRLGDFFEMFFDDAIAGSRLLGLTLTKRQDFPMCGIPAHAADTYVTKLLAAGKKVALCDQAEPAKAGKLVRRQLTRILSPGTTLAANQLDAARNHYLCALAYDKLGLHAAWLDLSTGEFKVATDPSIANLLPVLTALDPAELLVIEGELARWQATPHDQTAVHALHAFCSGRLCSELAGYHFDTATGGKTVMDTLGVLNLQGFGLAHTHPALGPAGAVVYYATENLCAKPENLRTLQEYRSARTLLLDPATLRNLEIFASARGGREGSLFGAINRTVTPAGARLLERWLAAPTLELPEIIRRQTLVAELLAQPMRLLALRESLTNVRDIPRILGRLQNRLRNPRELGGVRDTLAQLPSLRAELTAFGSSQLSALSSQLQEFAHLRELLPRALADELPADLADGNYIRSGYDAELDRLRSLTSDNKTWLSDLERTEQERTGIRSLKVRFTNNFGYYIEVTKANLHLVPSDYIRRQTTVGGERYVTEALRQKEKEIFHAEENALAREFELFNALVAAVLDESIALTHTAEALAELDVLCGWALLAREWDYCQPVLDDSDVLEISEGRHPVVEQMLRSPDVTLPRGASAGFVPNDTALGCSEAQIALITGPNMAGKSTYIRQVALIALLAQIGCWVPAKSCRIGLVDRIFSRVGASDDLARGNSTFMVEMNETANILNNTTDRSLIILDEIGRGTSTYDGLSIAWAVVEHLHRDPAKGPRTLFATHYQELTQLEKHLTRLRNLSVAVKEWNDDIVFVRRVIPGAADRSYGIQVARLAGLPLSVIDRAKTILGKLESDDTTVSLPAAAPQARPKKKITVQPADDAQLKLL
ncbi:DNA mismatch repair protein MutS [Opitutus terrae]|uniref:DNA mismatch repair protein MutS n=1 Tax=Opitutus terrae (strain DSM 11246 / JCM 15787 / PB90-1) TaxID=452637 RepID=B1ZYC8_OPITP|nr:DNA mismatch repair protein MutS [Opitutus terrae]ACB77026.1 DNA mismatch repair protein MutS [Opitutus terrae PB90-1]